VGNNLGQDFGGMASSLCFPVSDHQPQRETSCFEITICLVHVYLLTHFANTWIKLNN